MYMGDRMIEFSSVAIRGAWKSFLGVKWQKRGKSEPESGYKCFLYTTFLWHKISYSNTLIILFREIILLPKLILKRFLILISIVKLILN